MTTLILNDIHLGVSRVSGTTPSSAEQLRGYVQSCFEFTIGEHTNKDLLILGDLFDQFWVEPRELIAAYNTLSDWLFASGRKLTLVAGNHDHSPKGSAVSSFEFLCKMLEGRFPTQVTTVDAKTGLVTILPRVHVIPHMPNQDLFEMELEKSLDLDEGWLLLHCNYTNFFAEKSDHSLNITQEWAEQLTVKHRLMIAHEHQARHIDLGKMVEVLGNQWPSSVSDCLAHGDGQRDGRKYLTILEDDLGFQRVETWNAAESFAEVDWRSIESDADFIRVTGAATSAEAEDVINAIAKFRQSSDAFVITNAVKIEGMAEIESMAGFSLETVKSFDVMAALLAQLEPDEVAVIKEVMHD